MSHPSRVRGLKWDPDLVDLQLLASHPSRVRGLKSPPLSPANSPDFVAPFTGAWVEIPPPRAGTASTRSHPSRVRGLKS